MKLSRGKKILAMGVSGLTLSLGLAVVPTGTRRSSRSSSKRSYSVTLLTRMPR